MHAVLGWGVCAAITLCQFTDSWVFSFPLTFVPQQLEILDYSSSDIAVLVGAFAWANQLSFIVLTLYLCTAQLDKGLRELRRQLRHLLFASSVHFVTTLTMAMFPNFEVITAGRFVQGAVSPLVSVYGLTVVAIVFDRARCALAIAVVIAGSCGGELLGTFAGGYLFHVGGMRLPFYVTLGVAALSFLSLSSALVLARPSSGDVARATTVQPLGSIGATLKALLTDPFVLASCMVVFGAQCLKTAVEVILPLFLQNQLGANEMTVSIFSGVLAISFVFSSVMHGYLGDKKIIMPAKLVPLNVVLMAGSAGAVVYWTAIQPILLALGVFGYALGGTLSPVCDTLLQYCDEHPQLSYQVNEAVVVAVFNDFWAAGLVLGAFLAGVPNEFDRFSQRSILVVTGLCTTLLAACFAHARPSMNAKEM